MPQAFPTKNWVPRHLVLKYSRETHMIPRRLVIVKVQKLPRWDLEFCLIALHALSNQAEGSMHARWSSLVVQKHNFLPFAFQPETFYIFWGGKFGIKRLPPTFENATTSRERFLAPTGALYVMMCYHISSRQPTFSDFHSVYWFFQWHLGPLWDHSGTTLGSLWS